jgi:formylglycine-generating enzyme required for sulfatase activity
LATYGATGKGNHPINCTDFLQATAYCKAQGKRLPTEQEWEWAARGQSRGWAFPWGNSEEVQGCWPGLKVSSGACAVGSFPRTDAPGGIHDLVGNVYEWTSSRCDRWRIVRGGGHISDSFLELHAAIRSSHPPTYRDAHTGFCCAR